MNCEQVREALSADFDGELDVSELDVSGMALATGSSEPTALAAGSAESVQATGVGNVNRHDVEPAASVVPLTIAICDHIARCEACAAELRSYDQLRQLVASQPNTGPSPPTWEMIEKRLDHMSGTALAAGFREPTARAAGISPAESPTTYAAPLTRNRRWAIGGLLALAASVLLLVNLRVPEHDNASAVNEATVATINLQPLMELFRSDPAQALETLASQHPTEYVSLAIAAKEMGHPMVIQASFENGALPGNAQLVSTKVVQFPYCKCLKGACTCGPGGCQCVARVCQRPDGSTYLVLEHCQSQSVTFGDLPVQLVKRGNRHLQQVEVAGTMAISWEQMGERVTAIGLRDNQEIETMLAIN